MEPQYTSGSGSAASVLGHPIHPMLVPLPIGFLLGALICDIAFLVTVDPFWAQAAFWAIIGGLITGLLAGLAGIVEIFGVPRARHLGIAWIHGAGNVVGLVIAGVNLYVRHEDFMAAVVPAGLTFSAVTVVIIGITSWLGGEMSYRHGVGVSPGVGANSSAGKVLR